MFEKTKGPVPVPFTERTTEDAQTVEPVCAVCG